MKSTLLAVMISILGTSAWGDDLKIGLIGLDTSHVTAFTALLNDPNHKNHVPGGKVIAAFRGGSPDIESSSSRVDGYTKELQEKWQVKIMPSIEEVCQQVDCVMITSVDGRPHLEQARPVFAAKKRLFIDKPIGGTLRDVVEIYRLSKESGVPVFTSSAYRFYDSLTELKKTDVGEIRSAISYGPGPTEPHHPDLYWYGVHPAEALYTILGQGCEAVTRVTSAETDVVVGRWKDGRTGILHTRKNGPAPHKVTVFGSKSVAEQKPVGDDYAPLVREIIKFFQSGVSPVPPEETIELFGFMEAADESRRNSGHPVTLRDVMEKAAKR